MNGRRDHWSDEAIYGWFVRALAEDGSAAVVEPGVVRVVIEADEHDAGSSTREVEIVITREQLRNLAWATEDIFDDREPQVIPPAADPVLAGLQQLDMYVSEELATLRPDERYLVFFEGRLRPSVRRELPPVRGTPAWVNSPVRPGGYYSWTAVDRDDVSQQAEDDVE